jgi:small conductance mechanosensitive channel
MIRTLFDSPELAAIVFLALLARRGLRLAVCQITGRLEKTLSDPERLARVKTFLLTGRSSVYALIVIIAGLMILHVIGLDIGPLLAGAGLVGLALSLGAQTLIKDYIGGLLILFENQFAVGDVIKVGEVSGEVERITLRVAYLRDLEGRLHVVSNGDIHTVSNLTAGYSRAVVDLNVDYEADMQKVNRALEAAAAGIGLDCFQRLGDAGAPHCQDHARQTVEGDDGSAPVRAGSITSRGCAGGAPNSEYPYDTNRRADNESVTSALIF